MSSFELHAQLAADTAPLVSLPLCEVRLMQDARYPWLILIPKVAEVTDLYQLSSSQRHQLSDEIQLCSTGLLAVTEPFKLNVAALGNMVAQLHIHIIARNQDDPAWPGPVWGVGSAEPYTDADLQTLTDKMQAAIEAAS